MGLEIKVIGGISENKAQLLAESDNNWTSTIVVQGQQRLNVGIVVGTQISDYVSDVTLASAGLSVTSYATFNSIFSGTITLQRRMPEEDQSYQWRDVSEWAISSTAAGVGGSENITAYPEPETAEYRAGVKTSGYTAGDALVRIGTS